MKQFRKRMLSTGLAVSVLACSTLPTIKVYATNEVNSNNFYDNKIQEFVKEGLINFGTGENNESVDTVFIDENYMKNKLGISKKELEDF